MALEYDLVLHDGDGLQVVLEGAPADGESCYLLDDVQGLDGTDVREIVEALPDRDGDYLGPVRRAGRTFALAGYIVGVDRADLRARERALRAALAPTSTTWQLRIRGRVGDPEDMIAQVRVLSRFTAGDKAADSRRVKAWGVSLRSADAVLYGAAAKIATVEPAEETGGRGYPYGYPYSFAGVGAVPTIIENAGDAPTWPVVRLYGPMSGVVLEHATSGRVLAFPGSIDAGTFLEVTTATRSITLGGNPDASRYNALDRDASRWWPLEPGANAVQLSAVSFGAGAHAELTWRDAYQ